jgi:hypothetical protein
MLKNDFSNKPGMFQCDILYYVVFHSKSKLKVQLLH